MASVSVATPLKEVRLRVAATFVVVMLSVDLLNPVKYFCEATGVPQYYFGVMSFLLLSLMIYSNAHDLIYYLVKVFFHSVLSIFFTNMELLGVTNIPAHGPVIFTGNHMNQFVDAAMILITNPHHISFLVAAKSFKERIVGDFARAMGSIPVSRPQDHALPGVGKIRFDGLKVFGEGTAFTKLNKGDRLRPGRAADTYRVKDIVSDTEASVTEEVGEPSPLQAVCQGSEFMTYDILGFIDQHKMFDAVNIALSKGSCLGIFPEGGSHDNTDLLPLKVGVAAIALGVQEKYGISVPIVPVGLTYFRGDRFRGRVLVEYGTPIRISDEIIALYKENKRLACQQLLHQVEEGMRSVLVTATDYNELKLLHTVRRLYQRSHVGMKTSQRQEMSRRFSHGTRLLREKFNGVFPEDVLALQTKVLEYQDKLDHWGLKDYQVQTLDIEKEDFVQVLMIFLHGFIVFLLASVPSLILNAPVGWAAKYWAETQAKKDLQKSRVKVKARDVILSKKITFCLMAVPALWIFYTLLLALFTPLNKRLVIGFFICCPIFSYFGVTAVEAGMVKLKDIRPAFLRLFPGFKQEAAHLQQTREKLVEEVRAIVAKYGPSVGAVYLEQGPEWEKGIKSSALPASLEDDEDGDATNDSNKETTTATSAAAVASATDENDKKDQ